MVVVLALVLDMVVLALVLVKIHKLVWRGRSRRSWQCSKVA
jgi:hypothetical protein